MSPPLILGAREHSRRLQLISCGALVALACFAATAAEAFECTNAGTPVIVAPTDSGGVTNVGWGYYKSENAVGLTVNHRLEIWEDRGLLRDTLLMINAGASYGIDGDPVVRAGASFEF